MSRAVFAGAEDVVSNVIASCRRGPLSARVDRVEDEAGNQDMLNLRRAGRFSVLGTVWSGRTDLAAPSARPSPQGSNASLDRAIAPNLRASACAAC